MGVGVCPMCGDEFERLAQHWAMSSECCYPQIPEQLVEILTGLLMGDATIHWPESASNARLEITNVSQRFLTGLDSTLKWFSNGVSISRTSEEIRKTNADSKMPRFSSLDYEIRDQYGLTTARHPAFNRYESWYETGQKRFTDEIVLTPLTLKYWYVSDGSLLWGTSGHRRPSLRISATNEADRSSFLRSLFGEVGFSPTITDGQITFTTDETEEVLEYLGEPVVGYEYKFVSNDREEYRASKEEFYRSYTTGTTDDESSTTGSHRGS